MPTQSNAVAVATQEEEQFDLVRRTYARELSPAEFELLVAEAKHRDLSVVNKELISVKFKGTATNFVTLSGLRRLAERSGDVAGVEGPYWRGKTGGWQDVWLDAATPPAAAKFLVYRKDSDRPYVGIAIWSERAQKFNNKLSDTWEKMPAHMLGKVAETDAYKRARVVSENDLVSYEGDEPDAVSEPTVRVTEAKNAAMGVAHKNGPHELVKQVVKAINPSAGESLKDASVTAADLRDAADLIGEFGGSAADVVTEPAQDDLDDFSSSGRPPSQRELWRVELRDAFTDWNAETAAYIRAELEEQGNDAPWMWADAVELAPTTVVRDRFVAAALKAGVNAAVLEAGDKARSENAQVSRAAERSTEEFRA